MPSTYILVGAVALGTGLICLFCGFLWGRSKLRLQIEDAVDQARRIAEAREYNLREALEEKMLELSHLREGAEELPRLRESIEQLKSEQARGSAGGRATAFATQNHAPLEQQIPEKVEEAAPVRESADKAIQNLLKSIDDRMRGAEEESYLQVPQSAPHATTRFAVEIPPSITQMNHKPAPAEVPPAKPAPAAKAKPAPAAKPAASAKAAPTPKPASVSKPTPAAKTAPAAKDEWQEFAASLAALQNRKK